MLATVTFSATLNPRAHLAPHRMFTGLNYPAILDTAADVAKALLHLHLNDVLHGDLKATNVMLKSSGGDSGRGVVAKVADFGLSVRLDASATHASNMFQVRARLVRGAVSPCAPHVTKGRVREAARSGCRDVP